MRLLHVVGARPNFMKMAPVYRAFSEVDGVSQVLVHTGQHYDEKMSEIFFRQLEIPTPDINLEVGSGSHAQQTSEIMSRIEPVLLKEKPDWLIVYGDVNSTVAAAMVASKIGVKIAHVEAGLRSGDRTMPEEINRLLTDQISDLLLTPSLDGNKNLEREGIASEKIHLVGNVMIDTLRRLESRALALETWNQYGFKPGEYGLVTLHRPSNVDETGGLQKVLKTLHEISGGIPLLFPIHPRTRQRAAELDLASLNRTFYMVDPVGYLEFLALQAKAAVVITDSGGIQEETTVLGVPCLTVRENTERPITVQVGTNILVGKDMKRLKYEVGEILSGNVKKSCIPRLWDGKASERVREVVLAAK